MTLFYRIYIPHIACGSRTFGTLRRTIRGLLALTAVTVILEVPSLVGRLREASLSLGKSMATELLFVGHVQLYAKLHLLAG